MSIKVALAAAHSDGLSRISQDVPTSDESLQISTFVGGASDVSVELLNGRPDLAIVQLDSVAGSELDVIERATRSLPQTTLILLAPDSSPEFLMRAMRAGVREILPTPLKNGELRDAFGRQLERMKSLREPARTGKLQAFLPAKGGSGATFLATNLAYALSAVGQRVALIDLNLHFGDAALFLTEKAAPMTIAEVAGQADRLDAAMLQASMLEAAPNLWLLPAPTTPDAAMDIRPDAVQKIIALARARHDFVILDMGRVLESVSVRALDQCDVIHVVLQQSLPFVHDAKRLLSILAGLGYPREQIRIVLNRAQKGGDVTVADLQKALGMEVARQVPNSYANVVHSVNHGIPILKHAARDPVSRALHEYASGLAPSPERRGGWLRARSLLSI